MDETLREAAEAFIKQSRVVFSYIEGDAEAYCNRQYQWYRELRARLWKACRASASEKVLDPHNFVSGKAADDANLTLK